MLSQTATPRTTTTSHLAAICLAARPSNRCTHALTDGDPAYDNYKRPKLNSKMIKLRGMVTTLRKAASSERGS